MMMKFFSSTHFLLTAVMLIIVIFSSGCVCFQKPPPSCQARQVTLQQVTGWDLSGALSVTYNKKGDFAHFTWVQKENCYTINIFGPLNISNIRIVGDANNVTLWQAKKKYIRAKTPEQLIYDQLGWRLPVSNIRYWILAHPVPGKIDAINFDQHGHLVFLRQNGWQIKYFGFRAHRSKHIDLPQIIEIKNEEITIKIKVTKRIFW
ncbi:MAG: lipoprotein insertase outer membrane protein LolB [Coxiellaceae bacterium]|jgi:outer membrane lipoprotein LolB|nr:lipoprotein insertase outer membrane protein LolB [Coxiellaceae bacterium]